MIKKILAMIKRGLLEILYTKRKGIWALIYILLSIPYIPVIWKITIGNIAFISAFLEFVVKSFLYGSMALGLIVILIVIGRPFKTRNTENKLREIGLINHRGKVPTLCSFGKGSDKKRHEEIWVFLTNGSSETDRYKLLFDDYKLAHSTLTECTNINTRKKLRTFSINNLIAISNSLNVSIDYLLGIESNESHENTDIHNAIGLNDTAINKLKKK